MWFFLFILKRRIRFFVWTSRQKKIYKESNFTWFNKIWMHQCWESKNEIWYNFTMEYSLETFKRAATVSLTTLRKDLRVDSVIARNWTTPATLSLLAKWWSGACNVERDDRVKLSSGFVLFNSVSVRMLIDKFVTRAFDNEKFVSFALRYKIIGIDIFFLVYIITMQVVKV